MKVAVGSKNPVKVEAVKQAFMMVFPNEKWDVVGIEVGSEVSDQPMSDDESIKGARNRARKSMKALKADYGVGLEGGVHQTDDKWFDSGWMIIIDKKGVEGIGSTIRMQTPPKMIELINQGIELGHVDDILFKTKNSKHDLGHFGLMSNGAVTRTEMYIDGVISALVRYLHPNLF